MGKTVYLVRHGESLAQTAKARGVDRKHPSLRDCGITERGRQQAAALQLPSVPDLVVSSPLTRAIQTARIAFPHATIVLHAGATERGRGVPENLPRPVHELDLDDGIDASLVPEGWPEADAPDLAEWLGTRPERTICVFTHYNTIMKLARVRAENCAPVVYEASTF